MSRSPWSHQWECSRLHSLVPRNAQVAPESVQKRTYGFGAIGLERLLVSGFDLGMTWCGLGSSAAMFTNATAEAPLKFWAAHPLPSAVDATTRPTMRPYRPNASNGTSDCGFGEGGGDCGGSAQELHPITLKHFLKAAAAQGLKKGVLGEDQDQNHAHEKSGPRNIGCGTCQISPLLLC